VNQEKERAQDVTNKRELVIGVTQGGIIKGWGRRQGRNQTGHEESVKGTTQREISGNLVFCVARRRKKPGEA